MIKCVTKVVSPDNMDTHDTVSSSSSPLVNCSTVTCEGTPASVDIQKTHSPEPPHSDPAPSILNSSQVLTSNSAPGVSNVESGDTSAVPTTHYNGVVESVQQEEETIEHVEVQHSKPVSVIRRSAEDNYIQTVVSHENKSNNSNIKADEPLASVSIEDNSEVASPPTTLTNNGAEHDHVAEVPENVHIAAVPDDHAVFTDSKCDSGTEAMTKYDGPTPHQMMTSIEQEPAENGSSTSTDSGVMIGCSPKSDICSTPPTSESILYTIINNTIIMGLLSLWFIF